jgi:hypothetical protein
MMVQAGVQSLLQRRTGVAHLGLCLGLLLAVGCATGSGTTGAASQKTFATPEAAADALILAAENFDVPALTELLGPDGVDLVVTGDPVHDRNQSQAFAAQARTQMRVTRDAENHKLAVLSVGVGDWPVPIPIVEKRGRWRFDAAAGRQEVLYRRIGQNELDAIEVCRGYVEAQHEYALVKHDGALVNQYAQRIISTPGTQDGLAWQAPDGTWQGPVGEGIARVISEGYDVQPSPFHGYYFKVLTGQGSAAPLGEMDFVIEGAMIGGFALAAAPVDYGVTGVKTFIVSHDGVVYEQDLGPDSLDVFRAMERFNPDVSWNPVPEE